MKFLFNSLLFIAFCSIAYSQKKEIINDWGIKAYYGPQLSFFKTENNRPLQFGVQKNILGRSYGADVELRRNKWIFGISYSYNENKKRYDKREQGGLGDPSYGVNFTLRYIEQGVAIYADRKINRSTKNELFAGIGHVFSRGDDQIVEIGYQPGDLQSAAVYSYPSWEAGVIPKFRWQNNWKQNVSFGAEFKVHYLYSVDVLTNICFVPYLKVNL